MKEILKKEILANIIINNNDTPYVKVPIEGEHESCRCAFCSEKTKPTQISDDKWRLICDCEESTKFRAETLSILNQIADLNLELKTLNKTVLQKSLDLYKDYYRKFIVDRDYAIRSEDETILNMEL